MAVQKMASLEFWVSDNPPDVKQRHGYSNRDYFKFQKVVFLMAVTPVPLVTGSAADLIASGSTLFTQLGFGVLIMVVVLFGVVRRILKIGKSGAR